MKKRLLSAALSLCLMAGMTAHPYHYEKTFAQEDPSEDDQPEQSELTEGDYEYTIADDGTAVILHYHGKEADVTIPSILGGKIVTGIKTHAFCECQNLKSVTIPSGVTNIEVEAFYACLSFQSYTVDPGNPSYSSKDGVLYNKDGSALISCPSGKQGDFNIPDGVKKIEWIAFVDCLYLENIQIPETVTEIDAMAFHTCIGLKTIQIPKNVSEISEDTFVFCLNLEEITVAEGNPVFYSKDGVLYKNDNGDKTLFSCPLGKKGSLDIPEGTTRIDFCAFNHRSTKLAEGGIFRVDDPRFGYGCMLLESVTIPDSVTKIYEYAFYNCAGLKSIRLPASFDGIYPNAFSYCTGLENIDVSDNNPSYSSEDGVLYNHDKTQLVWYPAKKQDTFNIPQGVTDICVKGFSKDASLKTIHIPNSLTNICPKAFYSLSGLEALEADDDHPNFKSIDGVLYSKDGKELLFFPDGKKGGFEIPEGVTTLSATLYAKLTSITIPASLTEISLDSFGGCKLLTEVNVKESNAKFRSDDGVVYSKDGTKLYVFPRGKQSDNFQVPSGVTHIGEEAFRSCDGIKSITFPSTLTSIGDEAFYDCDGIKSITLPSTLTSIGYNAFNDCNNLTDVYYASSKEQWEKIEIDSGNWALSDATIHYNSTLPEPTPEPDPQPTPNPQPVPDPNPPYNPPAPPAPTTPVTPSVPGAPTAPATPSIPNTPTAPVTPSVPNTPTNPPSDPDGAAPSNPSENPGGSVAPDTPANQDGALKKGEGFQFGQNLYRISKTGSEVAFTQADSKKSVIIPSTISFNGTDYKVTSITANAFSGNKKLTKITIGKNVKVIKKNAFKGCKSLKSIIIKSRKLKKVGKNAFKGIHTRAKIKVPSQKAQKYKKLLKGKGQGQYVKITR